MKKNLYAAAILLALTSFAAAQATGSAADSSQQPQYGSQPSTQSNPSSSDPSAAMPQSSTAPAASQIQSSVQSALSKDTAFSGVNVSTENNQIVLTGHVATDADKQRAEQSAQSTAGSGTTVVNHITVGSGSGPSMAANDPNGAWSGQAQSSTPSGMSSQQSQTSTPSTSNDSNSQTMPQSGSAPSSDSGTGAMGNNASGSGSTANSGTSMSTTDDPSSQIQSAFSAQKNLAGVNVSSTNDQVVLSGTVDSKSDRDAAKKIAESYAGSRKVVDHITVGK